MQTLDPAPDLGMAGQWATEVTLISIDATFSIVGGVGPREQFSNEPDDWMSLGPTPGSLSKISGCEDDRSHAVSLLEPGQMWEPLGYCNLL